jgi:hypothetical protein
MRSDNLPVLISFLLAVVTDHNSLLFKDAIYCSVGLGANELFDSFDFNNFLVNRLVPEASNKEPRYDSMEKLMVLHHNTKYFP